MPKSAGGCEKKDKNQKRDSDINIEKYEGIYMKIIHNIT